MRIKQIINMALIPLVAVSIILTQQSGTIQNRIYKIDGFNYLSANEFASSQHIRTEFYDHNQKLVLRFPKKKTVLSADCSFLKVQDVIYQLPAPVIYDGSDFYVPALTFSRILNLENLTEVTVDINREQVTTRSPDYNIYGVSVGNRTNGSIVTIQTSRKFSNDDVAISFNQAGWMSLTVLGGKVDSINVVESKIQNPIRRLNCVQRDESAQLSFLLQYAIDDYEISFDDTAIVISLRTDIVETARKIKDMRNKWMLDTIVIDAGHGGKDPGAIGVCNLQEKTVALDIAKKLGRLIEKNMGTKVVYTREEDRFIPLWKRTRIANESGGKLFISIHANTSAKSSRARGFETYLLRPGKTQDAIDVAKLENSVIALEDDPQDQARYSDENIILATMAQSAFMKESEFLAAEIQKQLNKKLSSKNRGVKQAGFHVLVGASMPNVLIEVGFLSNKRDCRELGKASSRNKIAQAIYSAIVIFKDKYESTIIGENQ
ncbi:MAG: N-acetylmuramoyl-L-alanine amidase [FCB group bacterium]|nr:N-acetylmuramoyl-L-alanine amidase [FCB group bacterium]